jgi:hypothetical protein
LISGDPGADLDACIQTNDNEGAVRLLEAAQKDGVLEPQGQLLLGVMLFMPPFGDYESSRDVLNDIKNRTHLCEAAVWLAYHFYTLYREDGSFAETLEGCCESAAACYSLARYNAHIGNESTALEWNRRSLELERFPDNLIFDLLHNLDHDAPQRAKIFSDVDSLVVNKAAEMTRRLTAADCYQNCWDELILGRRMTSIVWQHMQTLFAVTPA